MYKPHPVCITPENPDVQLWRYMDFAKFASLIDRQALFFARVQHLRYLDPFEGSYSKITLDHALPPALNRMLADFDRHIVVNSWHINDGESAAMWDLYLREPPGVAIRSTFRRLADSFSSLKSDILIGKVRYIDHLNEAMPPGTLKEGFNGLAAYMCKRKSFQHEAELRALAIVQEQPGNIESFLGDGGLYIPVNLDGLIEEIVVSPKAPKWFLGLVVSVAKQYKLEKPVRRSTADEYPVDLRATDKTPLQIKCPQCGHEREQLVEASKIHDNADGSTVVFFARSITLYCEQCRGAIIVELKVENKSPTTAQPPESGQKPKKGKMNKQTKQK
jgi:hypothetical protein